MLNLDFLHHGQMADVEQVLVHARNKGVTDINMILEAIAEHRRKHRLRLGRKPGQKKQPKKVVPCPKCGHPAIVRALSGCEKRNLGKDLQAAIVCTNPDHRETKYYSDSVREILAGGGR